MTPILVFVVGMAIVAGIVWVMVRLNRINHQRVQRRREAWKAAGAVDADPDEYIGRGFTLP